MDFSSYAQLAVHGADAVARPTGGAATLLPVLGGPDPLVGVRRGS